MVCHSKPNARKSQKNIQQMLSLRINSNDHQRAAPTQYPKPSSLWTQPDLNPPVTLATVGRRVAANGCDRTDAVATHVGKIEVSAVFIEKDLPDIFSTSLRQRQIGADLAVGIAEAKHQNLIAFVFVRPDNFGNTADVFDRLVVQHRLPAEEAE